MFVSGDSDTTGTERRRVCIEVTFSTADNPVLDADDTVTFHGALVDAVIRLSGVTHNRLHDAHVVNSGSIIYYIEVKPPYNATDGEQLKACSSLSYMTFLGNMCIDVMLKMVHDW